MELTFIGSPADKFFWNAYNNFTLENRFKAEIVFKNDFNLKLFCIEFEYLRELKFSIFSEMKKSISKGDVNSVLKNLDLLGNDIIFKLQRYEAARPLIFILQNKVTQYH